MLIKMNEYYQGRGVFGLLLPKRNRVELLEPGREYEVDDDLGAFLLSSRKAEQVMEAARHLNVEPQFEQAEEPPKPEAPKAAVSRKRGKK